MKDWIQCKLCYYNKDCRYQEIEEPCNLVLEEAAPVKIYNKGKAISQSQYDRLKRENQLEDNTYYLVNPNEVEYKLDATKKWCSLSNAINKKYKKLIDEDCEFKAICELNVIKDELIRVRFFKEEDFEDWGEE